MNLNLPRVTTIEKDLRACQPRSQALSPGLGTGWEKKVDTNDYCNDDDYFKNYALCFIFLAILVMQTKDTAAEGDGSRNLISQKLLLSVFKSMGATASMPLKCL